MKKIQWGMLAGLAASVSLVAACQVKPPVAPPQEGTIGSGNNRPAAGGNAGNLGNTPNTGSMVQVGDATIRGKVLDENGNPVAGATVMSGTSKTLTGADGSYSLKVKAGEIVNIKVLKDGFILRDSNLPVVKGETLEVNSSLVKADEKVTPITASKGGTAVSADGLTQLVFPAGALQGDANVQVTWLNPVENESRPAAFSVLQVADTAKQGGSEDASPAQNDIPKVTALNTTDLPGPLETKAYGDRKFFSPVSFAAISMSNKLKDGESATLRMAISQEVLDDMFRQGDLKESDLGQEIFPCFAWSADESTWDKPALSKVVKDADGKYWFEYTVRANSMSAPAAGYSVKQVGDQQGSARVELQVGGGRRVVDGTFTYGALVERSSNEAYDFKGFSGTTFTGNNYYSPSVGNLIRPNVTTTNYTGTVYGATMGSAEFVKWDREGMFRLAFPPGAKYQITAPSKFGLSPAEPTRSGTTATATQAYLTPNPNVNATQTQSIAATYIKPFYYYTDAKLVLTLSGINEPDGKQYTVNYTLGGAAQPAATATTAGNTLTFTFARNAAGSSQRFVLKDLGNAEYGNDGTVSVDLPVGSTKTASIKMVSKGAK